MKSFILAVVLVVMQFTMVNAKVRIVTSTQDIASIAESVGGEYVTIDYLCRGNANPHSVELLPSFMVKVSRAHLYLKVGVGLDFWANPIIDGSRNSNLKIVDCSKGVHILGVPIGKVDASMGDVHREGNPHYWLNPENGKVIAENIRDALIEVDPPNTHQYQTAYANFETNLTTKITEWKNRAKPLHGMKIVTFHESWLYFAETFGLNVVGFIEPKPGIEPTPSHTSELVKLIKLQHVKVIVREPYFSDKFPNRIAAMTGARSIVLPPSVGGVSEVKNYFDLFDYLIGLLLAVQ